MQDFAAVVSEEASQTLNSDDTISTIKTDVIDTVTPDNGKPGLADITKDLAKAMKAKNGWGLPTKAAKLKALNDLAEAKDATLFEKSLAKLAAGVLKEEGNLSDKTMTPRKRRSLQRVLDQDISGDNEPDTGIKLRDVLEGVDEYAPAAIAVTRVIIGLSFANPAIAGGVVGAMTLASVGIGLRDVPYQFAKALAADWDDMPTEFAKVASMTTKGIKEHLWNLVPSVGLANFGKLFLIRGIEASLGHLSDKKKLKNLMDVKGTLDDVQQGIYEFSQKDRVEIGQHVKNKTVDLLEKEAGKLTSLLHSAIGGTGYTVLDIALTQLTARGYIGRVLASIARRWNGEESKFPDGVHPVQNTL